MRFEAIARCYFTRINFKSSSFDIDGYDFATIACFNQGADLSFVYRIAPLGKFFFAIKGLPDCHAFDFCLRLMLAIIITAMSAFDSKIVQGFS
jgi:hypothetical protein